MNNELKIRTLIDRFFDGSYMDFISRLVKRHEVSIDELKELIRMVEEE